MNITNTDVQQFQKLYFKNFGIELEPKQAKCLVLDMVMQMQSVYQPVTATQYDSVSKNPNENEDSNNEQSRTASNC